MIHFRKVMNPSALARGFVLFSICLATACSSRGCVESSFKLASESRLPRWVQPPTGVLRKDIKLELFYYGPSSSQIGNAQIELTVPGKPDQSSDGQYWWHPRTKRALSVYYATSPRPTWPDPSYIVIKIDGVTDVVEHRKGEQNLRNPSSAVFWMANDEEILKEGILSGN